MTDEGPMTLTIDSKKSRTGFQDIYIGRAPTVLASGDHSHASGRVEGEALRLRHCEEFARALFVGSQVRLVPKGSA